MVRTRHYTRYVRFGHAVIMSSGSSYRTTSAKLLRASHGAHALPPPGTALGAANDHLAVVFFNLFPRRNEHLYSAAFLRIVALVQPARELRAHERQVISFKSKNFARCNQCTKFGTPSALPICGTEEYCRRAGVGWDICASFTRHIHRVLILCTRKQCFKSSEELRESPATHIRTYLGRRHAHIVVEGPHVFLHPRCGKSAFPICT